MVSVALLELNIGPWHQDVRSSCLCALLGPYQQRSRLMVVLEPKTCAAENPSFALVDRQSLCEGITKGSLFIASYDRILKKGII